jgi:effector-binding domain-containing protein
MVGEARRRPAPHTTRERTEEGTVDEVTIKELPDQLALTVQKRVSLATVAQGMQEAFGAIVAQAGATGAQFTGPPFCLYPGEMAEEFDMVVCLPVAPGASAGGGVGLETVPGGRVASTVHHGPYTALGETYGGLQRWMAAHGHTPAGPVREVYLNDPQTVPAAELLTEIDWPVS